MSEEPKKEIKPFLVREGSLLAKIWPNATEYGVRHNVNIVRNYQDKDGNWKETSTFGDRDMLSLQHLTMRVHEKIRERKQELARQNRPKETRRRERWNNRDRER